MQQLILILIKFITFLIIVKCQDKMDSKITDLIKNENFSYSYEVTPDVNIDDIEALTSQPLFYSVTWHSKNYNFKDLEIPPLKLISRLAGNTPILLHLSCDLLSKDYLDRLLVHLKDKGLRNLLVVRGERYNSTASYFKATTELVKYIRNQTGDFFCIGVVGFPDSDRKLNRLKEKVESGADFIVTQAFFEASILKNFINKCKEIGVNVPVIPGIFYFETCEQLVGFTKKCEVKVSNSLLTAVEQKKTGSFCGEKLTENLIKVLRNNNVSSHYHFFTMNKLNNVNQFLNRLKMLI